MTANDTAFLSLSNAVEGVRRRELSSVEVTENILARIEKQDREINSYITVMRESARAEAKRADEAVRTGLSLGLLHGVPVAVKDLLATKGTRTTFACAAFAEWIPDYDATVIKKLREAGAIIVGKLNLHEAAAGSSSLTSHFGPVRNPWNVEFVAGGSSGGSGAAVAAGLAYGALGSDTVMSIRHPAAYCGIVGLKPTYGRVSKYGALPLAWSLDHIGPMTRRVRDAALMLQVLAGHDQSDTTSKDLPVPDFLVEIDKGARGLRIGVPRPHFFEGCTEDTVAAAEQAIDTLRALGAIVEDCELPHAADSLVTGRAILVPEIAAYHAERLRTQPELLSPNLRQIIQLGSAIPAVQYLQAQRVRVQITRAFTQALEPFDAMVMPTTPLPSCRASDDNPSLTAQRSRNTFPFNLTGLPALTVPCGFDRNGMPLGLQVVGRPFDEAKILRIAQAYEQATTWHKAHPANFSGPART